MVLGNPALPMYGISETKNPVWLDIDNDGDMVRPFERASWGGAF